MQEDYFEHGFTEGCPGCKAILKKAVSQSHNEKCRARMEKILDGTAKGQLRRRKVVERETEWIARKHEQEEGQKKKEAASEAASSSSACAADGEQEDVSKLILKYRQSLRDKMKERHGIMVARSTRSNPSSTMKELPDRKGELTLTRIVERRSSGMRKLLRKIFCFQERKMESKK